MVRSHSVLTINGSIRSSDELIKEMSEKRCIVGHFGDCLGSGYTERRRLSGSYRRTCNSSYDVRNSIGCSGEVSVQDRCKDVNGVNERGSKRDRKNAKKLLRVKKTTFPSK